MHKLVCLLFLFVPIFSGMGSLEDPSDNSEKDPYNLDYIDDLEEVGRAFFESTSDCIGAVCRAIRNSFCS